MIFLNNSINNRSLTEILIKQKVDYSILKKMSGYFRYKPKWRHHVAGVKTIYNSCSWTEILRILNLVWTTILQILLTIYIIDFQITRLTFNIIYVAQLHGLDYYSIENTFLILRKTWSPIKKKSIDTHFQSTIIMKYK